MKTCPVCKTSVFDDMDSCYGCMHRFDEVRPAVEAEPFPVRGMTSPAPAADIPVSVYDEGRFGQNGWSCPVPPPTADVQTPPPFAPYEEYPSPPFNRGPVAPPVNDDNDIALRAQHGPRQSEDPQPLIANPSLDSPDDGPWKVRLEVRVASSPAQVWSAEFSPSAFPALGTLAAQESNVC